MGRSIKDSKRLAEAIELGTLEAHEKMRMKIPKFTPESLYVSLREHVGKIVDTMTFKDVVDVVAAAGLTVIVHEAIQSLPNITNTLKTLTTAEIGSVFGSIIFPGIGTSLGALVGIVAADLFKQGLTPTPATGVCSYGSALPGMWYNTINGSSYSTLAACEAATATPAPAAPTITVQDFMGWLLSFAISWCIVKWGDKMINAGIGTLPTIISMLTAV